MAGTDGWYTGYRGKMFLLTTESKTAQLMLILGFWDVRCSTGGGELLIDGMFEHLVADRWFMAEWIKVWRHFHNRIYCSNYSILCSISPYKCYPNCSCKICQLLNPLGSSERIKDMAQRRHPLLEWSFSSEGHTASQFSKSSVRNEPEFEMMSLWAFLLPASGCANRFPWTEAKCSHLVARLPVPQSASKRTSS